MSFNEADVEKISAAPKAGSYKEEVVTTHHTDGTVHRQVSPSFTPFPWLAPARHARTGTTRLTALRGL